MFGSEFGMPDAPLLTIFGVLMYAVLANICYTGGWIGEIVVRKLWPEQTYRFAPLTLSTGLVFSVLLTLTPGTIAASAGIFLLVHHFLR